MNVVVSRRDTSLDPVSDKISSWLPLDVALSAGEIMGESPALTPAEEDLVSRAAERRRREFAFGRAHAKRCLSHFGRGQCEILARPNRAPEWPDGFVGSISHCDWYCAAILGSARRYVGLGLDIEDFRDLSEDVIDLVCTPAELEGAAPATACRSEAAMFLFCAKEAAYKALSGQMDEIPSFHDVAINMPSRDIFVAQPVGPRGRRLFGPNAIYGNVGKSGPLVCATALVAVS